MAQVTFFHYIHKNTLLHRMDGRVKLLCMLLLTISASLATKWYHYVLLACVISLALIASKLPLIKILKEMKFFGILVVIIILMNGWSFAGRLVLMLMISTVLAGTTPLLTVKNVVEWYLRPIPFVPEARIGTIVNLTFVLIPVIFDNYLEMMNAQRARCVELQKNPIRRMKFVVFPLLSRTLRRADEIVYAMESRCYSEIRTYATFETNKSDWMILVTCLIILLFVVF